MACHDEYIELISAALDGALSPAEQQKLEEHLAQCPACRETAAQLEAMEQALEDLPVVPAPPELAQSILSQLEKEPAATTPPRRFHWQRWAACAAMLAVILVGAEQLWHSGRNDGFAPSNKAALQQTAMSADEAESDSEFGFCESTTGSMEDDIFESTAKSYFPSMAPLESSSLRQDAIQNDLGSSIDDPKECPLPAQGLGLTSQQALEQVVEAVFGSASSQLQRTYTDDEEHSGCTFALPDGTAHSIVYDGQAEQSYFFLLDNALRYAVDQTDGSVTSADAE